MIDFENYAIATIVSDSYIEQGKKLISSILEKNKWLKTVIVYYNDEICPLSDKNKKALESFSIVKLINVDTSLYPENIRKQASLLKLEVFRTEGFEKILYLDADCIVASDLINIFIKRVQFGTVNKFSKLSLEEKFLLKSERLRLDYPMMLVSKEYRNATTFKRILTFFNTLKYTDNLNKIEKAAINYFFNNKYITLLNDIWCIDAGYFKGKKVLNKNLKVIHFSQSKPWISALPEYEDINKYYDNTIGQRKAEKRIVHVINPKLKEQPKAQSQQENTSLDEFEKEYQAFIEQLKNSQSDEILI